MGGPSKNVAIPRRVSGRFPPRRSQGHLGAAHGVAIPRRVSGRFPLGLFGETRETTDERMSQSPEGFQADFHPPPPLPTILKSTTMSQSPEGSQADSHAPAAAECGGEIYVMSQSPEGSQADSHGVLLMRDLQELFTLSQSPEGSQADSHAGRRLEMASRLPLLVYLPQRVSGRFPP